MYRLLRRVETAALVETLRRLLAEPVSGAVTTEAIAMLRDFFGSSDAEGSLMAGRAEKDVGDPEQVALATSILATDLLAALDREAAGR